MSHLQTEVIDERVVKALNLFKDADSVELKLTVPDTDRRSTIEALDLDVIDAKLRQVAFFDTPDLKLNHAGILVRARRTPKGGDVVVKFRPFRPSERLGKLRYSKRFAIEVDVMPGAFVCSATLKGKVDNADVKRALLGKQPVRKLLSNNQRSFYKGHAPKGVDLDGLQPFGPINVAKLKFSPKALKGREMVAELWFYPDGSRILELSTKCAQDEALQVLAETRAFLTGHGISLTGEQETKTRKAMEDFSRLHTH